MSKQVEARLFLNLGSDTVERVTNPFTIELMEDSETYQEISEADLEARTAPAEDAAEVAKKAEAEKAEAQRVADEKAAADKAEADRLAAEQKQKEADDKAAADAKAKADADAAAKAAADKK